MVQLQAVHDLAGFFRQTVLLDQRQHGHFHRGQRGGDAQHFARFAVGQLLHIVGRTQDGQEHAVQTDGGLHHVRHIALVGLRIEVLQLATAVLLVAAKVEVRAAVDAFQLLEAHGELELDVAGRVGVVRQLDVVVEAVVLHGQAQGAVPLHAVLLPVGVPLHLGAGLHEELHLHLLELAHAEHELPRHDLVAEGLAGLRDAEGDLHPRALLHVEEVHEDALCRFGAEVDRAALTAHAAQLGGEHQVELPHLGPVGGTAHRALDLLVDDQLAHGLQVVGVEGLLHAPFHRVDAVLAALHVGVGGAELRLIEGLAELAARLVDLLGDLLLVLADVLLQQHVRPVALLAVLVVDQRIVEGVHVAAGLPHGGVHEDGRVDAHDVLVELHHGLPPVAADVGLQLGAVRAVVVRGAQAVVDLAAGEHEAILLGMADQGLEAVFLIAHAWSAEALCEGGGLRTPWKLSAARRQRCGVRSVHRCRELPEAPLTFVKTE